MSDCLAAFCYQSRVWVDRLIPLSLLSSPLPLRPMLISGDMERVVDGSECVC